MKKFLLLFVLAFTMLAYSQENAYMELLRSDLKTQKKAVIVNVMDFSDAESKIFWPIYREYEAEREKLGDRTVALLKDYVENFENLTNEKAEKLVKESFDIKEKKLKLKKKYFNKVKKALNPVRAAQWIQLENQLDLIMEVQIAEQLPLIEPDDVPAPDHK